MSTESRQHAETVCTCGPWCEPFWEDADGCFECRFCGADWGPGTGFDGPWHQEWCVHGVAQFDGDADG